MAKRDRSRTPSEGSEPRSSGEYNVPGRTEPVSQAFLNQPPSVVVAPGTPNPVPHHFDPYNNESDGNLIDVSSPGPSRLGAEPTVEHSIMDTQTVSESALDDTTEAPTATASPETTLRPPNARFRSSALKIMQIHRTHSAMYAGAEPGADPRRNNATAHWGHIQAECQIDVVDYSASKVNFSKFDNQDLKIYLAGAGRDKPEWAKVRWISVGGISWDVVSAIALRYELHPLATEDVLRQGQSTRSKADYYRTHLFLQILCHSLSHDEDPPSYLESAAYSQSPTQGAERGLPDTRRASAPAGAGRPRSESFWERAKARRAGLAPRGSRDDIESSVTNKLVDDSERDRVKQTSQWSTAWGGLSSAGQRKAANLAVVQELKRGSNVHVDLQQIYLFLTRDGNLITFSQDRDSNLLAPIFARLQAKDTLLRVQCDPSLLLQAVLDLVVDKALEVVDRYHDTLLDLERQILIKPSVQTVRQLHIMSGDLTLHKRTLTPLSTLIYGLRRYDLDRAVASMPEAGDQQKVTGFCSHQTKVYLADVYDHMEYILSSVDMFSSIAENLINYTFNVVSYETNNVMRRLTIATVVFFPLTFLTGYFGQNFNVMPSVQNTSELMFWEIAFPVMAFIILCFTWPDIMKFVHAFRQNKMWHEQRNFIRHLKPKDIQRQHTVL